MAAVAAAGVVVQHCRAGGRVVGCGVKWNDVGLRRVPPLAYFCHLLSHQPVHDFCVLYACGRFWFRHLNACVFGLIYLCAIFLCVHLCAHVSTPLDILFKTNPLSACCVHVCAHVLVYYYIDSF